jgi:hypothetical protein
MRTKAVALAALIGAAIVTTPARGDVGLPGFVCRTAPSGGRLTVCVKGVAQLVPTGAATGTVVVSCITVVQGVVSTTGVGCQLNALSGGAYGNAPNRFIPGPVSETELVISRPVQPYEICVGGNYVALDGSLGEPSGWAAFGCFTTPL